jgi:hypothetical protein
MLHYMSWGRWPTEHKDGFFALGLDSEPAKLAEATMPPDHPVHSTITGRLLEGSSRDDHLARREDSYEKHATAMRAKLAATAVVRQRQPTRTASPTMVGMDKDRLHEYQKASSYRFKRRNAKQLKFDEACLDKTEKARRKALDKIAAGMLYLETLGYNGIAQLNRLLVVSIHIETRSLLLTRIRKNTKSGMTFLLLPRSMRRSTNSILCRWTTAGDY